MFASAMPDYWDYNVVRVERPDAGLGFAELTAAADRLQDGLRHRKLEVEDEAAGARLRADFQVAEWRTERLAWMGRSGPADPATPPGVRVEEVPFEATLELRRTWYRGEDWNAEDPPAVERFLAMEGQVAARRGTRALIAREDGRAIGFTALSTLDGACEVDEAFVLREHRGRGVGAALVLAALGAGCCAEQWIVADDEGRAKRLYGRLGFRTAWRQHAFVRHPQVRRRPPAKSVAARR